MFAALTVACWIAATGGHFVLTAGAVRRTLGSDASFDEQAFATVLGGIGTLSVVLHIVAATTGLSLFAGLTALACFHVLLRGILRLAPAVSAPPATSVASTRVAEVLALGMLLTVVFTWVDLASRSAAVTGTDAAHYHVPVAVNLALGAGVFDLPATQHPYPMAGSLLDAWFILPLGGPLIVDLAMCLPFLLLVASMNWSFRLATGQSGLAWASWVAIALFATPLFRSSSLVSADLWFASAFVAAVAVALAAWARQVSLLAAMVLGSLALGLLVGTKTTGAVAAALLVGAYVLFELAHRIAVRNASAWPVARALKVAPVAILLMLGAGGLWLVRNWHQFGSPIAPTGLTIFGLTIFSGEAFQPTTYLSVRGDLERYPDYNLLERAARFTRLWLGQGFVPALSLILLVSLDLGLAWVRRPAPATASVRFLLLVTTVGAGGVLVYLLLGAPWTSLEWTRGLSLRYALPIAALLPLVAFIALFPVSWEWYADATAASIGLAAVMVASLIGFASALDPQTRHYVNVPGMSLAGGGFAIVTLAAAWWGSARGRLRTPLIVLLGVVLSASWGTTLARRAERERSASAAQEAQERAAFDRGVRPASAARAAYYLALASEQSAGRQCPRRRFFALSRLDEPLMLQSADYVNQVFSAGRNPESTRRAVPLGSCDYVLTDPAVLETEKGAALVAILARGSTVEHIGAAGPFVVLRRR